MPAGADAYLLRHVIHDWDDAGATRILQCCRGAAANDGNMLVCNGGRRRSEAEFRALFAATGFALTHVEATMTQVRVIAATPICASASLSHMTRGRGPR